jgi:hypothetical protein
LGGGVCIGKLKIAVLRALSMLLAIWLRVFVPGVPPVPPQFVLVSAQKCPVNV